jgi:hypothetical protein
MRWRFLCCCVLFLRCCVLRRWLRADGGGVNTLRNHILNILFVHGERRERQAK